MPFGLGPLFEIAVSVRIRSLAALWIYCAAWALKDVLVQILLDGSSAVQLGFMFATVAAAYSAVFMLSRKAIGRGATRQARPKPADSSSLRLAGVGVSTTVAVLSSMFAIAAVGPVLFSLVDSVVYPLAVAAIAHVTLGERLSPAMALAMTAGCGGVIAFQASGVRGNPSGPALGVGISALAALSYGCCIVQIRDLRVRQMSPEAIMLARFTATSVILGAYGILRGDFDLASCYSWRGAAVALAVFAAPMHLSIYAIREIPSTVFGLAFASGPVLTYLFSQILTDTPALGPAQIASAGITLVAVFLGTSIKNRNCRQSS